MSKHLRNNYRLASDQIALPITSALPKTFQDAVRNYSQCFVSGWNINNPKSLISRDHTNSITNVGSLALQYRETFVQFFSRQRG